MMRKHALSLLAGLGASLGGQSAKDHYNDDLKKEKKKIGPKAEKKRMERILKMREHDAAISLPERNRRKGLKIYSLNGWSAWCLNHKNAVRKYEKQTGNKFFASVEPFSIN